MKTKSLNPLIYIVVAFVLFAFSSTAQSDAKAEQILKDVTAKTKSYTSIKVSFDYKLDNKTENIHESQAGSLLIKGNMFKLKIAGQEIYNDGETVWTYMKEEQEVQINEVDEDDEDELNPNNLFTIYENGFKKKFISENATTYTIDLFPTETKNYSRIRITINKAKKHINNCKVFDKSGTVYTYIVKSFTPNTAVTANSFTFNISKYPGVEEVDLR